ncbi:MAG TPA: DUF4232 domain-containing protein [Thermomicrobiales bacterium]
MEDRRIDVVAKFLAAPDSRRTFIRGAGAALGTMLIAGRRSTLAAGDYKTYVVAYYQAIAARRYKTAYDLLGSTLQANQSYDGFVAGYSDTDYVELNSVKNGTGGTSSRYPIDVVIVAWHTDGTIHQYDGTYYVGIVGGTPKIVGAKITEGPAPTNQPPLCRAADLGATSTGNSATGSRFLTITLTNKGHSACVLGGFPRTQVRDASHARVISASEESGVTITTVRLEPNKKATLDLRWNNWCDAQPTGPLSTLVTLPGNLGHLSVPGAPGVPPCLGDRASHLTEKPFAPA